MKLQTFIFSSDCCERKELYYRSNGDIFPNGESAVLAPGAELETDTYMNAFDASFWLSHCAIGQWGLEVLACGSASLVLLRRESGHCCLCDSAVISCETPERIVLSPRDGGTGRYFLRVRAESETRLLSAAFVSQEAPRSAEIRLGAAICTFHRGEMLAKNMGVLRASRFFDESDGLSGSLQIHVVDNGSELPTVDSASFRVFRNPNTGGSGGFTRALSEFRRRQEELRLTHVVFMDDDVELIAESFYRLHAFLSYLKEAETDTVVAGRMFRRDERHIQYTAAEIWNGGDLRHVGFNCDMTDPTSLESMNDSSGAEYGGWWFCCYPIRFAMENEPMPFFLHCDDVEYGLRHGGTPLILNGVQVWHETYEYRQSALMRYYDTRNPLFVNERYPSPGSDPQTVYDRWFRALTELHVKNDYCGEYMMIAAMWDYLKGTDFLSSVAALRRSRILAEKKSFSRLENALLRRLAAGKYHRRFSTHG